MISLRSAGSREGSAHLHKHVGDPEGEADRRDGSAKGHKFADINEGTGKQVPGQSYLGLGCCEGQ